MPATSVVTAVIRKLNPGSTTTGRASLLGFEGDRDPEGLEQCEPHRTVSCVARYLPPTRFTLLPKLLQAWVDVGQELHDDGRRDCTA